MASMDLWGDQHEGGEGAPRETIPYPPFVLTASDTFGATLSTASHDRTKQSTTSCATCPLRRRQKNLADAAQD